ncbi:hypothetical protein BGZ58_001780, partial [Dissophora ornata]
AKFPIDTILTFVETFASQPKPHLDGIENQYLALPRSKCLDDIVGPGTIGIDGGHMCLNAFELKKNVALESVMKNVLVLIQGQLSGAKGCSEIFMVGGLALRAIF